MKKKWNALNASATSADERKNKRKNERTRTLIPDDGCDHPAATTFSMAPTCLSFDVEEYYHIEAAYQYIDRAAWANQPSRVEASVERLLTQLASHGRVATFFILGDVARRCPRLAMRIAQQGHEIACHGQNHDRLHRLNRQTFRQDVLACQQRLEDQTGCAVQGYRAPTFSIVPQTCWAIDVLAELGFTYDASVFPVRHPAYGVPDAPLEPFWITGQGTEHRLLELPPLVWRCWGRHLPVAGGGYFRLFPLWFMKQGLAQASKQNRPAVLYFHPWEFDPEIPRLPLGRLGRFRTYVGLRSAEAKLERLLKLDRHWTTLVKVSSQLTRQANITTTYALNQAA